MSDTVRALKDKATELMAKGKVPAALETWQKVVQAAPEDLGARQKVAELYAKQGRVADAVKAYEDLAQRFADKGQFFKASAVCRLILGFEPNHQRTQQLIASLYARNPTPTPSTPAAVVPRADAPASSPAFEAEVIAPPTASGQPSVPLFSMLSAEELQNVVGTALEVRHFKPGEVIVAEGAPGDSLFALAEGSVSVYRGWKSAAQRRVATMAAGELFGEVALMARSPRVATVVADGHVEALELHRDAMARVIATYPRVGELISQFCQERLLANMMRASPILQVLPEPSKRQLGRLFTPRTFRDGERIIREGQPATSVHMLLRGVCSAKHQSGGSYPDLREGDLFGEVSVLTDGSTTATVTARGPVLTLELSAEQFKGLLMQDPKVAKAVNLLAAQRLSRTADLDTPGGHDTRV